MIRDGQMVPGDVCSLQSNPEVKFIVLAFIDKQRNVVVGVLENDSIVGTTVYCSIAYNILHEHINLPSMDCTTEEMLAFEKTTKYKIISHFINADQNL